MPNRMGTQDYSDLLNYLTFEQMNTIINFQRLWQQLGMWMRALLVSIMGDLGNKMAITERLFVGIPTQFYELFKVFYGPQLASQFRDLIADFIQNAWMLMEAMNEKDGERCDNITVQWYESADQIATFLARINIVYWDRLAWQGILYQFIRMYIDEMRSALSGDYDREVALYDSIDNAMFIMGSYMARGIIARGLVLSSEKRNDSK